MERSFAKLSKLAIFNRTADVYSRESKCHKFDNSIQAHERDRLEELFRYRARPAISENAWNLQCVRNPDFVGRTAKV